MTSLTLVKKHFPAVKRIIDSRKATAIEITRGDVKAQKKDPEDCAVARACVRRFKLDGAIVLPTTTFLVKGNRAIRYSNPASITREITAFDRGAEFLPGKYRLSPHKLTNTTAARKARRKPGERPGGRIKYSRGILRRHRTLNVRTVRDV